MKRRILRHSLAECIEERNKEKKDNKKKNNVKRSLTPNNFRLMRGCAAVPSTQEQDNSKEKNDQKEYDDLEKYAYSLRLLKDIPLTYLLTDISDLEEESIKFGIIDINWTDAYIDGAFSIGRVCTTDAQTDDTTQEGLKTHTINYLETPRMRMMHPNNLTLLQSSKKSNQNIDISNISVVLIRSEIVKIKKGLHFEGYDNNSYDKKAKKPNNEALQILRIEKISDDIMICLFNGIIDTFIIEEPMTSVKFGCDKEKYIDLRSTIEKSGDKKDYEFGKPLPSGHISIKAGIDENNGRIHPKLIVQEINNSINNLYKKKSFDKITITPSSFAFEMLSVPHKAVFCTSKLSND